jgi:alpha-L-fucosidase
MACRLADCIDALLKSISPAYDKPPGGLTFPISKHFDYRTYEYVVPDDIQPDPWELVRGIGLSFCYNQNEEPSQWLTFEDLAWMFVDVVSKNGNLLLNVGPKADGSLQEHEVTLLERFGGWMKTYGDALYDTRPWGALEKDTYSKLDISDIAGPAMIRFTEKNDTLHVFFKAPPAKEEFLIPRVRPADASAVNLWLGPGERIKPTWRADEAGMWLTLPADLPDSPWQCVSIEPLPMWNGWTAPWAGR